MNKSISILMGSGFSFPAAIPSVSKINDVLTSIKQEDIFWGEDGNVFLLNNQPDPNAHFTMDKKNFFVEFIKHYCDNIDDGNNFDYEEFYDYYYSMFRENQFHKIESFCEDFRDRYNLHDFFHDDNNLLLSFNNGFNQIIKYLLGRTKFYENNVHEFNYRGYEEFIKYLVDLSKSDYTIHIHSLNHDLLFDHIGKVSDIQSYFCDGYSEMGLTYFGDLNFDTSIKMKYKVRLKGFQNSYDKAIRFYKLHGSIDTYSFNLSYPDTDRTRIKTEFLTKDIYKEIYDKKTKEHKYIRGITSSFPDFLSGTTEKLRNYSDEYYDIVFNHFKNNLRNSQKLIIIGYGLKDKGINNILKIYLDNKRHPAVVIDPYIPNVPFYHNYKFTHIQKSVSSISHNEWNGF